MNAILLDIIAHRFRRRHHHRFADHLEWPTGAGHRWRLAAAPLVSFAIGALCLAVIALLRGGSATSLAEVPAQPLWSLLGGMLGAGALLCNVLLAPRIGLTLLLGLAVAGQLTASLLIDHFALLGAAARPLSPGKLMGYLLMISGLAVLVAGDRASNAFRWMPLSVRRRLPPKAALLLKPFLFASNLARRHSATEDYGDQGTFSTC